MKMKVLLSLLIAIPAIPVSAQQVSTFEECRRYIITERYTPGYTDHNGYYQRGDIHTNRNRTDCYYPTHYQQQINHTYVPRPHIVPSQNQQSIVNQPIVNQTPQRNCDSLSRLGLGIFGGGTAGRYIGGGKKSRHTIRNTTIGAIAGGILAGVIPC